jgi:kynurenine formamidase
MGRALLIDLSDIAPNAEITPEDLKPYQEQIRTIPKVVLNIGWAIHWGKDMFFTDFPVITVEAAQFLVDCGTELIGVDIPSVDKSPNESHFIILGNDTLIIENLTNLDLIEEDVFHLVALPLKITGRDGSPVRVAAVVE